MGTIGRIIAFAMLSLAALSVDWNSPVAAQSSPGEYRTSIDNMYLEMRALWGELDRFKVEARYCNPSPPPPSKAQAQAELAALEQRVSDANRRYNALKQSLLGFLDRNHRLYAEMMVNGRDPRDRQWWSRDDNNRQRMLDELARKKAALAAAPEVDCRPKPKPKPAVTTGGFQPPALPVRPSPTSVTWPALPTHFCSYDEKIEFLKRVAALLDAAGADAQRAARFRTEVEQAVNSHVQNDRPVPPELIARRRQAIADVEAANQRVREAEGNYNRANAIPVIDCRQPVQDSRTGQAHAAPQTGMTARDFSRVEGQQALIGNVEGAIADLNALRLKGDCNGVETARDDIGRQIHELDRLTVEQPDGARTRAFPPELIKELRRRADAVMKPCPPTGVRPPRVAGPDRYQSTPSQTGFIPPSDPRMRIILDEHNKARADVGVPRLQWDPQLAAAAASYAAELARTGQRVHAPREGRGAVRENLNQGMLGWNPRQMVQNWTKERQNFVPGTYPNVTRTGRWQDVSHYTQMIWPTTTHVGCGLSSGSGYQWLVCRYSPGGNKDGQPVGSPSNQPVIAQDIAPPNSSTPILPRDLPRLPMGGGMTQIDPPPPPPPTARDEAPEGKEENHPLVRYGLEADAAHAAATDCGNATIARLELEKMRYALDELKKRKKAARKVGGLGIGGINPDDVQRQIDELERRIRDAELRKPRPAGTCPLPPAPPPPPPPPP